MKIYRAALIVLILTPLSFSRALAIEACRDSLNAKPSLVYEITDRDHFELDEATIKDLGVLD